VAVAWGEFERAQPGLAEAGRVLLYQDGVGLAFLATVRADGGPRVRGARHTIWHEAGT
jgi:hypothetical protein